MSKKNQIEREVSKTIESLDGLKPAGPKPFFYGRLENHLKKRYAPELKWSLKPVFQFAVFLIILFLNVYALFHTFGNQEDPNNEIEYLTEEYSVSYSLYDDIITEE